MKERLQSWLGTAVPASLILFVYVALMGVPGHRDLSRIESETERLGQIDPERLKALTQRKVRQELRLSKLVENEEAQPPVVAVEAGTEWLRTAGRLLAEHQLVLIEEGPLDEQSGAELVGWQVVFDGSYAACTDFVSALAAADGGPWIESLDMATSVDAPPRWTMVIRP